MPCPFCDDQRQPSWVSCPCPGAKRAHAIGFKDAITEKHRAGNPIISLNNAEIAAEMSIRAFALGISRELGYAPWLIEAAKAFAAGQDIPPRDDPGPNSDDRIRAFAQAILHGDHPHRAWLLTAAEQFINGQPVLAQQELTGPSCARADGQEMIELADKALWASVKVVYEGEVAIAANLAEPQKSDEEENPAKSADVTDARTHESPPVPKASESVGGIGSITADDLAALPAEGWKPADGQDRRGGKKRG